MESAPIPPKKIPDFVLLVAATRKKIIIFRAGIEPAAGPIGSLLYRLS
jgi:hypothetical protein